MKTEGRIWLKSKEGSVGKGRIELLQKIDETGSISKAAKAIGISYKSAWESIDKLNNMSDRPLVTTATGGKSGGGSKLTEYAREIIRTFYEAEEKHERLLDELSSSINDNEGITFFEAGTKNLFRGRVSNIVTGGVNATVAIKLREKDSIGAVVTKESLKRMKLKKDDLVYALVNESDITLVKGDTNNLMISARNQLLGFVSKITISGVSAEIAIELSGGQTIHTIITAASADIMDFQKGDKVTALFKARNVILLK